MVDLAVWRWASIFMPHPDPWGLRGDPFAWQAVEAEVTARGVPSNSGEAQRWTLEAFEKVVGVDPTVEGGRDEVLVADFAHGGISSGYVHVAFWRESLLPLLDRRATSFFAEGDAQLSSGYAKFAALAGPFVEAVAAKKTLLDPAGGLLDEPKRRRVLESMSDDLRKLTDIVVGTVIPVDVSQAAGIDHGDVDDLQGQTWHTQPSFDPNRERFVFEHTTPVRSLRSGCLELTSTEEMVGFLWRHVRCAWITRTENSELMRLGYASRRVRPLAAYSHAGIQLVGLPSAWA